MSESTVRTSHGWRSLSQSARRGLALAATGAMVVGLVTASAGSAQAAVPDFPNNLVVFPDRDFITIEGYQDYLGQNALVEVKRPGVGVVGSAIGVVGAGDVAFEINHPGGYCWGAGTGVNVTPDIIGGDVVSITIGGVNRGETTVSNAAVTGSTYTPGSATLKVNGVLGPEFSDARRLQQLEQRIVNPAFTDTAVNRRDVRAVTGGPAAAPKGGYISNLVTTGTSTFEATYDFDTPALAELAANGGGFRMMSWQLEDAAANRQGLTIAEFGEAGGPGFGGCPNGPLQSGPPAPTNVVATPVANGYKFTWDPAVQVPGTPPITGYEVTALAPAGTVEQRYVGKRVAGRTTNTVTMATEAGFDSFEIVSVSSVGKTFPAVSFAPAPSDTTAPVLTANPVGGSYPVAQKVNLTSNEARTDIYYTLGESSNPLDGPDTLSPAATHYTGSIDITADTVLRYVGFDLAGNVSTVGEQTYAITNTPAPAAPQNPTVTTNRTGTSNEATIAWTNTDTSVTGFTVTLTPSTGTAPAPIQVPAAGPLTATFANLVAGTTYTPAIRATNANGSTTATLPSFVALSNLEANAGPDQSVNRGTTVTLDGSASAGATYLWEQVGTNGAPLAAADKVTITNATQRRASFALPLYAYPMSNGPLTFKITASRGTQAPKTDLVQISPINDRVVIAQGRYKAGDFRMAGTATTVGATITVRNATTNVVIGRTVVTAAVAPATGGAWELRLRTNLPGGNPGQIVADSSQGGSSAVFATTT